MAYYKKYKTLSFYFSTCYLLFVNGFQHFGAAPYRRLGKTLALS